MISLAFCQPLKAAEVVAIHFCPSDTCHDPIIELYDAAKTSIHLAIYSLTKDEIADALVRAHNRGVKVKVLIDKAQAGNQYADDETLEDAGIKVRRDKKAGFMHNKFAVIDGTIVYTGSYNHTDSATTKHDENYIILKGNDVVPIYEAQFQALWEKHQ